MTTNKHATARRFSFGAIVLFLSFVASFGGVLPAPTFSVEWNGLTRPSAYVPVFNPDADRQLILVFIGSSTCGFANHPRLPETIGQLKILMQTRARNAKRAFAVIGIARDQNTRAGKDYLEKFGYFDGLSVGRGSRNSGLSYYMYEQIPGPDITPQVLVIDRHLRIDGAGTRRGIRRDELLVRKAGLGEIFRWLEQGAPIPGPIDE